MSNFETIKGITENGADLKQNQDGKGSGDELQPVNSQVIYRESVEFKLDKARDPSEIQKLFQFNYWGKKTPRSQRIIRDGFTKIVPEAFEQLDDGWYRGSCCFAVPAGVTQVRAFNLSVLDNGGTAWTTILIRHHKIEEYRNVLCLHLKLDQVRDGSTDVVEISRKQLPGTIHGAQVVADAEFGRCLAFDGVDDFIEFSSHELPIGDEPYTIEAWIRPDEMGDRGIVGWGNADSSKQVTALRLITNGLQNDWWSDDLEYQHADLDLVGNWRHVAATFDGKTRRLYVNGQEKNKDTPNGHQVPNSQKLTIGSTYNFFGNGTPRNGGFFFKGRIAVVRIWGKALTEAEINRYKELDKPRKIEPVDPHLQLHLPLNELREGLEQDTKEVQDFSGHERHGELAAGQPSPQLTSDERFGSCLAFDKDSGPINVLPGFDLPADKSFTFEVWVKTAKPALPSGPDATILRWGDELKVIQQDESWKVTLQGKTTITFDASAQLGDIADGQWHQLAITVNRELDEISVFLDQTWVASQSAHGLGALNGSRETLEIAPLCHDEPIYY